MSEQTIANGNGRLGPGPTLQPARSEPLSRISVSTLNLDKFRDCCLFSIAIRKWGNRAGVRDMKALQEYIALLEAAKREGNAAPESNGSGPAVLLVSDRVKSTKVLVRSKTYEKLCSSLSEVKAWCLKQCMPSYFRSGMFVVKADKAEALDLALRQKVARLFGKAGQAIDGETLTEDGPVPQFLAAYPADVDKARTNSVAKGGLGPLFREADYPAQENLAKFFGVDWLWLALSVPENIPDALKQEAGEKFKRRLMDAADDIETALRSEFKDLLDKVAERLTTMPGEKPKTFRDSLIGNLIQFIETFGSRDVFNDGRLGAVVEQAKATLLDASGNLRYSPEKLREFASVRELARKSFEDMSKAVEGMIQDKPTRKFDFEVEE